MIGKLHRKKTAPVFVISKALSLFLVCTWFGDVHAGIGVDGELVDEADSYRSFGVEDDHLMDDDEDDLMKDQEAGEEFGMDEPPLQEDEGHLDDDEEDESEGDEKERGIQVQEGVVTGEVPSKTGDPGEKDYPAGEKDPEASRDPDDTKKSKVEKYQPAGFTAVVGNIGFQYGITNDSVGGFKLGLTYGYRLTDWIWFDAQVNFTFGGSCVGEAPVEDADKEYACGSVRGFGIEAIAGAQWKFYGIEKWQAPVVPFVRAGLGVVAIISNGPNDGAALVARGSGGVRYHFFPWFAVGGELGAAIGPAFRNHLDTGLYAALDVMAGAEFHF